MHESVRTSPGTRRILSISLALLIAFAFTVLLPAGTAHGEAVFYITGKGWGHGIGLSQYGAKGFAEHGWTYDGILAHYYQQTTLGTVANRSLLVNMDASKAYRLSWTLRSGRIGGSLNVGGAVTSGDHRVRFTASGSTITATDIDTGKVLGSFSGSVTVTDRSSSDYPLIEVQDATGPFTREHVNWRGAMKLVASNSALKLVNVVPLEHYLYGVVPRESISSWHMEALKAQAVAARSYAYVTDASAELYCTARSQVWGGTAGIAAVKSTSLSTRRPAPTTP
jgi:stage II sporulation protein D